MEVEKLRNYISIVIIGSFVPDRITAEWVAEKGIVPEKAAQKKRTRRLERNLSVFNISNSIEVVVTNERLQKNGGTGRTRRTGTCLTNNRSQQ